MSAEIYITESPTRTFRRIWPRVEAYEGPSRVWKPAQELIEEGADGIRKVELRLEGTDLQTRSRLLDPSHVVARNLALNQAAIITGITIQEVEKMLLTGKFSELDFVSKYNQAVGYSDLRINLSPSTLGETPIPPVQIGQMMRVVRFDPTLAEFLFKAGFDMLPEGMRRLITDSGTILPIRSDIAPIYRSKARENIQ